MKAGRPKITRRKKLLFASLVTIAFFVLLEVSLAALGIADPNQSIDPLVGFSNQVPLMQTVEKTGGVERLATAPGKSVWFNLQQFGKSKPARTKRIFCVGGSTTYGRPFLDSTSYCRWLRELLPNTDRDHDWEVINAGGISYASYRVAALMEELADYDPDIFIVYSAQNEFLEQRTYAGLINQSAWSRDVAAWFRTSRTFTLASRISKSFQPTAPPETLSAEVDERLNHSVGPSDYHRDDQWHQNVLIDYEFNLRRMIQIARDAGAEIVFVAPASNELDCSPFKSEPAPSLKAMEKKSVSNDLALAKSSLADGNISGAIARCESVLKIDPRNPAAHYLLGTTLFKNGEYDAAQKALATAIDEDICPLRATTGIRTVLRRVADEEQIGLVDFEKRLRELSQMEQGHDCLGESYFLDHVHPNLRTHEFLGKWILEHLLAHGCVDGSFPSDSIISETRNWIESEIDVRAKAESLRNLAKVLHWSGKFDEAMRRAMDALNDMPDDLESRFIVADCLTVLGRSDDAAREYEMLFEIGEFDRAYLPFGWLLHDRGNYPLAQSFLLQATIVCKGERLSQAYYLLASCEAKMGDYEKAVETLRFSDKTMPNQLKTMKALCESMIELNRLGEAKEVLTRAERISPDDSGVQALKQELADLN